MLTNIFIMVCWHQAYEQKKHPLKYIDTRYQYNFRKGVDINLKTLYTIGTINLTTIWYVLLKFLAKWQDDQKFSWKSPFLMGNWTRVRKRTEACSVKGSNGGPRPSVMVGAQIITRNCIRLGSEHFSMFWSFASFLHNTHWWAYTTWQGASTSMKSVRPACTTSSAVLH